jgi:hypothetical protein
VMEGVEKMGQRMAADQSRVDLRHAITDLQLMKLHEELRTGMTNKRSMQYLQPLSSI